MGKKYYAVKVGKTPGVYDTWAKCKSQVDGVSGATYKGFTTYEEAEEFVMGSDKMAKVVSDKPKENTFTKECSDKAVAYVDGSYSDELKQYAYGCAIIYQEKQTELSGADNAQEYVGMRNVAGEILGSMKAIEWAIAHNIKSIDVYHDYEGIAKWANGDWKANKLGTQEYKQFIQESRENIEIHFIKVVAHTGVELNERADILAKAALGI